MVELEFAIVEVMISSLGGYTPFISAKIRNQFVVFLYRGDLRSISC